MQPLADVSTRTILLMGDPRLRQVAAPVSSDQLASQETQDFIDSLVATMRAAGGAGLAAT
jgi:peptide deformylase